MSGVMYCPNCGATYNPTANPHFCSNCGAALALQPQTPQAVTPYPGQPADGPPGPGSAPPGPGSPPDHTSRNLLIAVIAVLGCLLLAIVLVSVFILTRKGPDPIPTPSIVPDASTSPSGTPSSPSVTPSPASGWIGDPTLRNVTLPARASEGHGCLASATTLVDGKGSGSGVYGNGDAGPVQIALAGDPLVGRFSATGPTLRIYPLYCFPTDQPIDVGAMIDVAITDSNGIAVPMDPNSVFDTVAASMRSSQPIFFPMFDPTSLKLAGNGSSVVWTGRTVDTSYKKDEIFDFTLTITQGPVPPAVQLMATSVLVRVG